MCAQDVGMRVLFRWGEILQTPPELREGALIRGTGDKGDRRQETKVLMSWYFWDCHELECD